MFVNTEQEFKIIDLCSRLAAVAHEGQHRKDNVTPYIVHPARVVSLVSHSKYSSVAMSAAAWLHDIIEDCVKDTGIIVDANSNTKKHYVNNMKNIFPEFSCFEDFLVDNRQIPKDIGQEILVLVKSVSHSKEIENKKDRKLNTYKRLAKLRSTRAIILKACDRIDNLSDMSDFSIKGKEYYIDDTHLMLGYIGKELRDIDEKIFSLLYSVLENAERKLEKEKIENK